MTIPRPSADGFAQLQHEARAAAFAVLVAQFAAARGLDLACLRTRARRRTDQDNLFPSVLGLMRVNTSTYKRNLDLFAGCGG